MTIIMIYNWLLFSYFCQSRGNLISGTCSTFLKVLFFFYNKTVVSVFSSWTIIFNVHYKSDKIWIVLSEVCIFLICVSALQRQFWSFSLQIFSYYIQWLPKSIVTNSFLILYDTASMANDIRRFGSIWCYHFQSSISSRRILIRLLFWDLPNLEPGETMLLRNVGN